MMPAMTPHTSWVTVRNTLAILIRFNIVGGFGFLAYVLFCSAVPHICADWFILRHLIWLGQPFLYFFYLCLVLLQFYVGLVGVSSPWAGFQSLKKDVASMKKCSNCGGISIVIYDFRIVKSFNYIRYLIL